MQRDGLVLGRGRTRRQVRRVLRGSPASARASRRSASGSSACTMSGRPSSREHRHAPRADRLRSRAGTPARRMATRKHLNASTPAVRDRLTSAALPGTTPPMNPTSTHSSPRPRPSSLAARRRVVVAGIELSGMSSSVVTPPAAAARVAVSNPSQSVRPGSLMWTCVSTRPGITTSRRHRRHSTRAGLVELGDARDAAALDVDGRGRHSLRRDDTRTSVSPPGRSASRGREPCLLTIIPRYTGRAINWTSEHQQHPPEQSFMSGWFPRRSGHVAGVRRVCRPRRPAVDLRIRERHHPAHDSTGIRAVRCARDEQQHGCAVRGHFRGRAAGGLAGRGRTTCGGIMSSISLPLIQDPGCGPPLLPPLASDLALVGAFGNNLVTTVMNTCAPLRAGVVAREQRRHIGRRRSRCAHGHGGEQRWR